MELLFLLVWLLLGIVAIVIGLLKKPGDITACPFCSEILSNKDAGVCPHCQRRIKN